MERINSLNAQPNQNGTGKAGFSDNTSISGMDATYLTPDWCNAVQEELCAIIEGSGGVVTPNVNNQVWQVISKMAGNLKSSIVSITGSETLSAAQVGSFIGFSPTCAANSIVTLPDPTTVSGGVFFVDNSSTSSQSIAYTVRDSVDNETAGSWILQANDHLVVASDGYNYQFFAYPELTERNAKAYTDAEINALTASLDTVINNETAAREAADNNEANTRENADNALQAQINNISETVVYPKPIAAGLLTMSGSDSGSNTTWSGTVSNSAYGGVDVTNPKYLLQPSFLGLGHLPDAPGGTIVQWSTTKTSTGFTCTTMVNDNDATTSSGINQVAWVVWQLSA